MESCIAEAIQRRQRDAALTIPLKGIKNGSKAIALLRRLRINHYNKKLTLFIVRSASELGGAYKLRLYPQKRAALTQSLSTLIREQDTLIEKSKQQPLRSYVTWCAARDWRVKCDIAANVLKITALLAYAPALARSPSLETALPLLVLSGVLHFAGALLQWHLEAREHAALEVAEKATRAWRDQNVLVKIL
jgi:hypothetical protein